jgi:surfactin synthase thioesterase subunit
LVDHIVGELLTALNKPFALFGHSMGALLAFEVARELRRRRAPLPDHLFVSGARAPQRPSRFLPIHRLPDDPFIERLRRLGATPEEILCNAELMSLILPAIRADFEVYETYVYRVEDKLECPVSAYGGRQDRRVSPAELAAWGEQTRADFSMLTWPGDHFFLRRFRRSLIGVMLQALSTTRSRDAKEPRA